MKSISYTFLSFLLLISPLAIYLEWGGGKTSFLAQVEITVLRDAISDPVAILHPLIIAPLCSQIICILIIIGIKPKKTLFNVALVLMGILVAVVMVAGLISGNSKTILSVIPFQLILLATVYLPKRS